MNYFNVLPDLPDYVSVEDASKLLGISKTRVYKYINDGRIHAVKASQAIMIPIKAIEEYKRNITGRPRRSTPAWRIPPDDNNLRMTRILVNILPQKTSLLKELLLEIKQSENYTFPGTIARYICLSTTSPEQVEIELVWRGTTHQNERKQYLEAFQHKFSAILDWHAAQYSESTILMHT